MVLASEVDTRMLVKAQKQEPKLDDKKVLIQLPNSEN